MSLRRVSVVIPCHDAETYLAQAVGSALDQRLPPHEVIVVDDASNDGSLLLAQRLAAGAQGRVRVLSVSERSAAAARNAGALVATGDALVFLDADDVLQPGALSALSGALTRAETGFAVCPWYRLTLTDDRWVRRPASSPPRGGLQDPLSAWLTGWYHPPCAVMWSRDAFERAGRWDEAVSVNDDGDLVLRALAYGIPLVTTSSGGALYRRPPPGTTTLSGTRTTAAGLDSRLHVLRKLACLLEERGSLRRYRMPLWTALALVAREAGEEHPAVVAQAAALSRRFAGAALSDEGALRARKHLRVLDADRRVGRVRRRLGDAVRSAGGSARVGAEVHAGLDEAARLLERSSSQPLPGPEELRRPLVSVVIPTYNRSGLVLRALRSVLSQSMQDLEVLVVDDGSTDDTAAAVTALDDPRVRYLQQHNAGVAAARNRGIREARGQLLALLDSDDEWSPDKLARQLACLRESPARVALVYTGVVDDDGEGGLSVRLPTHRGDVSRDLLQVNVLHGGSSSVLMRRHVVATVGFFDESLPAIEDHDYWIRACRFFEVDFVAEPLVRYHDPRMGLDRRSRALQRNLSAREQLHRKHRSHLRQNGLELDFVLMTARRHLSPRARDAGGARRIALRTLLRHPRAGAAWRVLLRTLVPAAVRARRDAARTRQGAQESLRVLLWSSTRRQDRGGVQAVYDDLATGLRARGHVVLTMWSQQGPSSGDGDVLPLTLPRRRGGVVLPWTVLPSLSSLLQAALVLRRSRPDVVNVHFVSGAARHFLLLRRGLGYRLVLSAHGSDVLRPLAHNAPHLPRLLREADAVTAVTRVVADAVRAQPGVDPARLHIVPNGVDLDFWSVPGDDLRDRAPVVLAVGRLHAVKGFDVLVEAMSALRKRVPEARLVVAGDGELADALPTLAERHGVAAAVSFPGHLTSEQVRALMSTARAFALPSRSEGMPLALLEAMAAGLPVVATAVGGVPDVLSDGCGALVPPEDPDALAGALADVLLDDEHATAVADRGRARAAQFSRDAMTQAYEDLFRRLADKT